MPKSVDSVNRKEAGLDTEVFELLHAVMHRFRSRQYRALGEGPDGITHMESKVLGFFARHAGATQGDLARHSGRDKAQLARLIKGLRERGLLSGEADDADRRNVRLQLTAAGQALQRSLQRQGGALEARALDGISDANRRSLAELLRSVMGNLDRQP